MRVVGSQCDRPPDSALLRSSGVGLGLVGDFVQPGRGSTRDDRANGSSHLETGLLMPVNRIGGKGGTCRATRVKRDSADLAALQERQPPNNGQPRRTTLLRGVDEAPVHHYFTTVAPRRMARRSWAGVKP